jgi:peptidoglycan/xylan/chitin deacetylase (PgdA/CDA1 family)
VVVVTGMAAALLTVIGAQVAELVAVNSGRHPGDQDDRHPAISTASVTSAADRRTLKVEGEPGTRVVMLVGDRAVGMITLDEMGNGAAAVSVEGGDAGELEVVALDNTSYTVKLPELPTPIPTASPTASPTAKRRAVSRSAPDSGPTPALSPPVLQLITDAGPQIALTFDGNSSSNRTDELLDLLQELELEVTLFVTGRFIERYPEVIRRAVLSGHEVGNHTYSHPHLTTYERNRRHDLLAGMTKDRFQSELRKTEQAFRKATGRPMMPLWRAPYGEENRLLRGWALDMGYLHIRWSSLEGASLDSRDWVADEHSSLYQDSSSMMERLLRFPELRGGIVLMHMATHRDEAPWAELPDFIATLRRRGVEPSTVMNLLESSPRWRPWLKRAQDRHDRNFGR